jgi:K+-transporting ATPase ATPase C chain
MINPISKKENNMDPIIKPALKFLLVMTLLTGIIYPLFITGMAQLVFRAKANGSLVIKDSKIVGSRLVGQKFDSTIYFWTRPSAIDYNPVPSAASNLGPTSSILKDQVTQRRAFFAAKNSVSGSIAIPSEMIFASASGLDPHISPESAILQMDRIVTARSFNGVQKEELINLIDSLTESPQFHLFGERRINVFLLNLNLDRIK